jgi:hypothetical protein
MAYEARTAVALVKAGLGHLQELTTVEVEYHVPLLLLATGYERLLKVFLCLEAKASCGSWPDTRTPSFRWDHDLRRQVEEVDAAIARRISGCPTRERRPFEVLRDPGMRDLVELLETLLEPTHYFSLGQGGKQDGRPDWVEGVWRFKISEHGTWSGKQCFRPGQTYADPDARGLVVLLERSARAICKGILLVADGMGETASYHAVLHPFAGLPTRRLGGTRYRRSESEEEQAHAWVRSLGCSMLLKHFGGPATDGET